MQKIIALLALGCIVSCTVMGQSNITKVEYFFNADPGFGKGSPIPITAALNVHDIPYGVSVSSLPLGLQVLFIRSANANNVWSITSNLLFLKTALPPAPNIVAAEWFTDTDPGFGSATPITLPSNGMNVTDIPVPVDITRNNFGLHTLFVRSKDNNGKWSITNNCMFLKTSLPLASSITIVKAEYFIDIDPGFDKATPLSKTINGVNVADVTESVNLSSVTEGLHHLFIRSKDAGNKWSITNNVLFYKTSNILANLNDAEYFIDADPGFGNGHKFPLFTPAANLSDISYSVDLGGIDSGIHKFFIRSKNADNKWSITNYLQFRKTTVLPLTLLSFDAEALNNQVMLEWQTDNEVNTGYFDVEYAVDGVSFSKIATVAAKGVSSIMNIYNFIHTSPLRNSSNYYRLKQVDIDGKFTYSPIRSVKFVSNQTFAINPNPVHNKLTIYTSERGLTLNIFESSGKKLMSRQITASVTTIDFSSMENGMYYAVAERNGKPVYTRKILKQ